jgi:hypothetical protein
MGAGEGTTGAETTGAGAEMTGAGAEMTGAGIDCTGGRSAMEAGTLTAIGAGTADWLARGSGLN